MKHIIPFYLFFSVSGGIAGLVLLFLVYRKNPRKDLLYFNIFFLAMTADIFIDLILMYRSLNVTNLFELQDYLLSIISIPFSLLFFTAFPMAIHRLLEVRYENWRNIILISINTIAHSVQFFPMGTMYNTQSSTLIIGPLFALTGISQMIIIVYSVMLILFGFKRIKEHALRKLLILCGVLTLLFIPGFFHDITYSMGKSSFSIFPIEIISFPLYYFFLAVIIIVYAGKYFIAITEMEKSIQPSVEFLDNFQHKHHLTQREIDVIPLIVEGMGNKQIATELIISTKTVNNHIYNLYKKLKINSRFELLAMLQSPETLM